MQRSSTRTTTTSSSVAAVAELSARSGSERSVDPRDRGKTWTHNETDAMIRLWASDEIQLQLRSTLRNNHVFRVISKRLSAMGYARTPDQCRTKVKSLKSTYRRLKDLNNPKKAQRVFCFYELFDRTLSKQRLTMSAALGVDVKAEIAAADNHPDDVDDDIDGGGAGASSGWYMRSAASRQVDTDDGRAGVDHDSITFLDGSACEDNSNGGIEEDEVDEDDDDDDDSASLLDTLPLAVQLGNCSDDMNDLDEEVDQHASLPCKVEDLIDEGRRQDTSAAGRRDQLLVGAPFPPPNPPPPPKRRRTTASKAAQNHQEELADRILAKYMTHEERLVQHFLKAEEKMWTRLEQMEERRMKFEQEMAAKQQREDGERFRQLFLLLSSPTSSHVTTPQPAGPPRVVYMQEVGPPSWTN